jgi:hypothetical protein
MQHLHIFKLANHDDLQCDTAMCTVLHPTSSHTTVLTLQIQTLLVHTTLLLLL